MIASTETGLRGQWSLRVLFAVVVVGVGVFAVVQNLQGLRYADEREYLEIATSIVRQGEYSLHGTSTAFRPPVWPLLIAAAVALGVPPYVLPLLSVACLTGAAVLVREIASRIAGDFAGWIAAFGVLIYPLNVYTAATLYPQTLATLLLFLPICLVLRIQDRPHYVVLAGIGLSYAMLVLAVPTMVWSAICVAAWSIWRLRTYWVRATLVVGIAALLPIAIWAARNYVQLHYFVPVSTASGINLLLGNNPAASASTGITADVSAQVDAAQGLDEVSQDRYFSGEAAEWVHGNPGAAVRLYLLKVLNYFAPYNAPATENAGSRTALFIGWATFVPLLLVATCRVIARSRWPIRTPEALLWTLFVSNAFFMAIAFTRTRFRQPLDAVLIIEAAVLIAMAVSMWRRSRARS